jgi:2-iminobutanoate/2-iminopropanoate deaminase
MQPDFLNPTCLAAPLGPYSHIARVPTGAGLIFMSGQVALGLDGHVGATLAEQADQVYSKIVAGLAEVGAAPSSIVKLTTFLVEDDPERVVGQARVKHLGDHRPASSIVWVRRLSDPAWKVEVEAVAVLPSAAG